jgi:two-component system KDP operon response regulator KdpE
LKKFKILIVDDEERILNFLRTKLKALGYEVLTAADGREALEQVQVQEPDMVVLDLVMPKKDGFETLKELRAFSTVPVIILSAKGADVDKLKGFSLGADDYLSKPFSPDELVARIEAIKRRVKSLDIGAKTDEIIISDVVINFKRRSVSVRGEEKYLPRTEWLLLSELARNIGRLILYEDLLTRVWGPEYIDDVQMLRTWISRLRHKLERDPKNPKLIRTIPKAGYIIDHP